MPSFVSFCYLAIFHCCKRPNILAHRSVCPGHTVLVALPINNVYQLPQHAERGDEPERVVREKGGRLQDVQRERLQHLPRDLLPSQNCRNLQLACTVWDMHKV